MNNSMVNWLRNHRVSRVALTLIRVYIGVIFLMASYSKLGSPFWTGTHAGVALNGFLQNALTLASGPHAEVTGWYAWILTHVVLPYATFFSMLVSWGEFLTGIALIVGCFTNFAALMGVIMNLSYLLAGVSSANPLMLVGGLFILFAGHNAATLGVDYWITPWTKQVFQNWDFRKFLLKKK